MSKLKRKCNEIMNELEVKEVEGMLDNTEKKYKEMKIVKKLRYMEDLLKSFKICLIELSEEDNC